ncbi:hypothetical protein OAF54_02850 [bacterium]|nr:hypothetical protein [bacterium]
MATECNVFIYRKVWAPVYEGEEGNNPPADTSQAKEAGTSSQASDATAAEESVKFNEAQQQQMNKILASERRKAQQAIQRATEEAQAASKKASLTAQERTELEERLSQIRDELLTKEELAQKKASRAAQQYKEQTDALAAERDKWHTKYTKSTIQRAITDAAAKNNAFSPRQIVSILGSNTRLVEVLDSEGQPTGDYEPKIKFNDTDKDGKSVVLDLSPTEAVSRMKEIDEYLNLFRGEGSGGTGLRSQPGGKKPDVRNLARDAAAYRAARKKGDVSFN